MKTKYEGIRSGSYSERAIDIVIDMKTVLAPALAAKLDLFGEQLGFIRRAVDLGFLQITKSDLPGHRDTLVYVLGKKFKGREYGSVDDAGQEPVAEFGAPPAIAQARTVPIFKPLDLAKLGFAPQRAGAWDFRNIPSVYARNGCA